MRSSIVFWCVGKILLSMLIFGGLGFENCCASKRSRWGSKKSYRTLFKRDVDNGKNRWGKKVLSRRLLGKTEEEKRSRWEATEKKESGVKEEHSALLEYFQKERDKAEDVLHNAEVKAESVYEGADRKIEELKAELEKTSEDVSKEAEKKLSVMQDQLRSQIEKSVNERIELLSTTTKQQIEQIQQEARAMALRVIADAESQTLQSYLAKAPQQTIVSGVVTQKHVRAVDVVPGQTISKTWRENVKRQFEESINYLKEIVSTDEELLAMLDEKKVAFDMLASGTEVVGDESYKTTLIEKKRIEMVKDAQSRADDMLKQAFEKMQLSDAKQKKARLSVLFELNSMVHKNNKEVKELSNSEINQIVVMAIDKAKERVEQSNFVDEEEKTVESSETEDFESELEQLKSRVKKQEEDDELKQEKSRDVLQKVQLTARDLVEFKENMEALRHSFKQHKNKVAKLEDSLAMARDELKIAQLSDSSNTKLRLNEEKRSQRILDLTVSLEQTKNDYEHAQKQLLRAEVLEQQLGQPKISLDDSRGENSELELLLRELRSKNK